MLYLCFGEKEEVVFRFVQIHAALCLEMAVLLTHVKGEIINVCQSSLFPVAGYIQSC